MNKTAIKSFAIDARKKLISEITYRAGLVGINKDGISEPIHKASGIEMYDIGGNEPYTIKGMEISQRNSLALKVRDKGFENVIEEVAYTWFNRIIAIRFMEANDYLPTRVRVLSSENKDKIEPDIVTEAPNVDLGFTPTEIDEVLQLKHDNKLDELFRLLFIKQCNTLNDILPELFEKTSDYTELLLSISFTNEDSIVRQLVKNIHEDDFRAQVEIIGWMYQYYNTDPKAKVDVYVKQGVKVIKEDIPAKTQLFTPDWIVRYMVENSLGRLWVEGHPDSNIKENWKYYLEEADQEQDVKVQLDKIREGSKNIKPEDIKFIDPSMGSGHILVYAFDVLMNIYRDYGYSDKEAARLIVEKNLYGIDIDDRAYQLAYFAVMMKARYYSRRILVNEKCQPQLYAIKESDGLRTDLVDKLGMIKIFDDKNIECLRYIIDIFKGSKEYGSIITIDEFDGENLERMYVDILLKLDRLMDKEIELDLEQQAILYEAYPLLEKLISQAIILSDKYDVVVTNPPYLSSSDMNLGLYNYVKKNYPNSKSDLFAVFIEKGFELAKQSGFNSMVTMQAWMFLSSYEKFRKSLLTTNTILNLMQMENNVMPIAFGTCATVFRKNMIRDFIGTYNHIDTKDITKEDLPYEFPVKKNRNSKISSVNFAKIPGNPIAYWVSNNMRKAFDSNICIADIAPPKQGLATADNDRFLRVWYEINHERIGYNIKNCDEAIESKLKWFPYNKGGAFRRWYGNREYVVNWENDGFEIKNFKDANGKVRSRPQNIQYYFKSAITWSDITSASFSGRYCENGFMFDVKGSSGFPIENKIFYVLGFLNSDISQKFIKILNPTVTTQVGDMARIPVVFDENKKIQVDTLVIENIAISKSDWDSFEISWDFTKHPLITNETYADYGTELIKYEYKIKNAFECWKDNTVQKFAKLKVNEEELNQIFIDIYGLHGEVVPEVEEKNVTIRRADLGREIRSFVSYAVGCMFGRYSLDNDGLIYAGGQWDDTRYKTYKPDNDNIIPITDDEYFNDDMVGKFVKFVKVTYGSNTIEENLNFIANALGNKGGTSREVIRNYFIKDFYKDHIKTYKKRPIYWMFDSGKENGFKALIYMHRYNEDTVARVRTDYLHKVQKAIENAIESADIIIDSATSSAQKGKVVKQKEKLVKQLAETRNYDAAIAHVASKRIGIDLDDGVTVNYAKFQGVEVSREGKKAVKIDLLSKI